MLNTSQLDPATKKRFHQAVFTEVGISFQDDDPVWCDAREVILTGGWRACKSTRGAGRAFRAVLEPTKDGLLWLLGPDYMQTNEEFRYLFEWASRFNLMTRPPTMPTEGQKQMWLRTGWQIVTKSARYPEKLGSVAPNGIILCE